jgi:tetratricopeptide (TPR) repeat protein
MRDAILEKFERESDSTTTFMMMAPPTAEDKTPDGSAQREIEKIVSELWVGDFHSLTQSLAEMEALLGRYTESAALYGRIANLLITASSFHGAEMDETLRDRAIECARRALELDDSEPFAHLALAKSLVRSREADWGRALEHWKESFKRAPGELWVQVFRAFYDIETGRPEMSVKRAEKILEQSPDELMVLPVMSLGSLCAGRFHKALEWGERLLRSRPQDSLGLCLVFYSDLYLGKVERALLFAAYLRKQRREASDEGRHDPLLEALVLLADCFERPENAAARLPRLLPTGGRMSTRVLLTACAVLENEELGQQCMDLLEKFCYRDLPLLGVDPYVQEQFAGRAWYADRVRALAAT